LGCGGRVVRRLCDGKGKQAAHVGKIASVAPQSTRVGGPRFCADKGIGAAPALGDVRHVEASLLDRPVQQSALRGGRGESPLARIGIARERL
jgi:hypothetical protein